MKKNSGDTEVAVTGRKRAKEQHTTGTAGERTVVRAPISGVVAEARATPGVAVGEGQLLHRIVAVDRVHVVGAVPEQYLARVQNVKPAEIEVPGLSAPLATTRQSTCDSRRRSRGTRLLHRRNRQHEHQRERPRTRLVPESTSLNDVPGFG